MITRAKEQANDLASLIERYQGNPIVLPLLSFRRVNNGYITNVISKILTYHWIVFTSKNGVQFFLDCVEEVTGKREIPSSCKIAVVGKQTNEVLHYHGLHASIIPKIFVAESLLEELKRTVKQTEKVLIVKGNMARDIIASELTSEGIDVTELIVYETVMNQSTKYPLYEVMKNKETDFVLFTSSSTVHFFVKLLENTDWRTYIDHFRFISIGPVTSQTMQSYHIPIFTEANPYTGQGMINSIIQKFKGD
ncbi:MAG: uroporphyrinogen-III synthase [Bacillaceae bacterium]|nr:uroporphyrinogen-III synthase [Bacillaceae bacterium]